MRKLFFLGLFFLNLLTLQAQNQSFTYHYCDDDTDGIITLDLTQYETDIFPVISFTDVDDIERVLICTNYTTVMFVDTPSTNPVLQLECDALGGAFTDIAVDASRDIYTCNLGQILLKEDNDLCTYASVYDFISDVDANLNALSFDTFNNLYYGSVSESIVYRFDPGLATPSYVWHDFGVGRSGGDFVSLGDKLYISWKMPNIGFRLYEVTVDADNNYISHTDLGELPNNTYGLASELGHLYGVSESELFEINLEDFTFNTIVTNDFTYGNWYGAAGYHEAIEFNVSAHISNLDANNNDNPLPDNWTNTVPGGQTIYLRIENLYTGEYTVIDIILNITISPETTQPDDLIECTADGLHTFDLTNVEDQLLANVTSLGEVTYHRFLYEAEADIFILNENYQALSSIQEIYVRVENMDDTCFSIEQFNIISSENPILEELSTAPNYSRFLNNCYEDANQNIYFNLNDAYQLVVLDTSPLTLEFYLTLENAENGTNQLPSTYYSTPGLQEEIFVKAYNDVGCYSISNVFIDGDCIVRNNTIDGIYFPPFFTPNGDGENDYWTVLGLTEQEEKEATIKIFDRYGKLLYAYKPFLNLGWDGTFKNNKLPSSDYWFIFSTSNGFQKAGHFSLVR